MKKLNVSILALCLTAASAVTVAAQGGQYYDLEAEDYSLNARFTSGPTLVTATGLPEPAFTDLEPLLRGTITTDGAGKIDGVQHARVYFDGPGNHTNNYATFVIGVTGSIRARGAAPAVKMKLKGPGYVGPSPGAPLDADLSLKFTSSAWPTLVFPSQPVAVKSTNYAITYLDGRTVVFTNGPATNSNPPYYLVTGTLTGTIKPGKDSGLNDGRQRKVNEAASLISESWAWTVVNDTNFVQQPVGGSLVLNTLSNLTGQVSQPPGEGRIYLAGELGSARDPFSGNGPLRRAEGTFSLKLKGDDFARGAVLNVNGTLGPLIVGYEPSSNLNFPTGYITNRLLHAVKGISFSGKAFGQEVPLTSGVNPDAPFPGLP